MSTATDTAMDPATDPAPAGHVPPSPPGGDGSACSAGSGSGDDVAGQEDEARRRARRRAEQQRDRETLAALRTRWPALFPPPPAPAVPLAVGIAHQIRAALEAEGAAGDAGAVGRAENAKALLANNRLDRALRYWTRGVPYQRALAEGQRRHHLDGSDAGEPEPSHCARARALLAWHEARRQRTAQEAAARGRAGVPPRILWVRGQGQAQTPDLAPQAPPAVAPAPPDSARRHDG